MATICARGRATGVLPEDQNKNPSKLQKELERIFQKTKQNKPESVRQGGALEQSKAVPEVIAEVEELPYVEVQPLPSVTRGHTKSKDDEPSKGNVEMLLDIPKLTVEPGFKNRAPLQLDEKAKDLVQEILKNPICITAEDLLNVSEPMRQELKKLLLKKRLEKKSVTLAVEFEPVGVVTSEQRDVETISVDKLPEATYEVLAEDTNGILLL